MNHLATGGLWLWRWPRSWALTLHRRPCVHFPPFSFFNCGIRCVLPCTNRFTSPPMAGQAAALRLAVSTPKEWHTEPFHQCLLILLSIPAFQDSRSWEIFLEIQVTSASLDANSLASWINEKSVWQPFFPPRADVLCVWLMSLFNSWRVDV